MIYEILWFFFLLGMGIFLSIGLFGLLLCPLIKGKLAKDLAFLLSLLILGGGIYLSYKWHSSQNEISNIAWQAEQAMKKYTSVHDQKG